MKAIDKTTVLATEYKKWIDELERENKQHPAYISSYKYYNDIVANLLWIQQGLCAYTEMFLIDSLYVRPELWANGRFKHKVESLGSLDHFDSDLKTKHGKGWDWDNFFVVLDRINQHKGVKKVNMLKPDLPGFNPFYYLEYDNGQHLFSVNRERNSDDRVKILEDIKTLGLNYGAVISARKQYLEPLLGEIEFSISSPDETRAKIDRFHTAFEMSVSQLPQ